MTTKKISLNELRSIVKQIIKEENHIPIDIKNQKNNDVLVDFITKNNFYFISTQQDVVDVYYHDGLGITIYHEKDNPKASQVSFSGKGIKSYNNIIYVNNVFDIEWAV
jgi:hypothetical protein